MRHATVPGLLLCLYTVLCLVIESCPSPCDPMDCSPPGSSVHGDSPGKNTGAGCHARLQEIFPTQGSNQGLLHCRWIFYHLSHQGNPIITIRNYFMPLNATFVCLHLFSSLSYASSSNLSSPPCSFSYHPDPLYFHQQARALLPQDLCICSSLHCVSLFYLLNLGDSGSSFTSLLSWSPTPNCSPHFRCGSPATPSSSYLLS